MVALVTRRSFDPQFRAGPGKAPQAEGRRLASLERAQGRGPFVADGPGRVRVASSKAPAVGTIDRSVALWSSAVTIVTWSRYESSDDVLWTSATTATIATAGWYDLNATIGAYIVGASSMGVAWYKNGAIVTSTTHFTSGAASQGIQTQAWEPRVRLNIGDTVAVYVDSNGATNTVNETRCAIRLVQEIPEMQLIKATGSTVAYDGRSDEVWLTRDAASSSIADTLTSVSTISGLPPGLYQWTYHGIYQTTATTTGVGFAAAFSGTATGYAEQRHATTGGAAATAAATGAGATASGNLYEAQGERVLGSLIGAVTVSVDAANTDTRVTVEGDLNVTVAGDFSIQQQAESAGLASSARIGSLLILRRLS